jgi:hypothetical protein
MSTTEMTAWLGPAADDMTPEQLDRFARIWDDVDERYPDEDHTDRRDAALSAAVQYLLGGTTIDQAGHTLAAARAAESRASAASQQMALMAVADGIPEAQAARRAGIDRMWLRKLLGK